MKRSLELAGAYPREEALVKATWNEDKGLNKPGDLDRARLGAMQRVLGLQAQLGFAPVTNGQLAWQDAFRPFIEHHPSFTVGGLQRLFETNKFYRQPVLRAGLASAVRTIPPTVLEGLPRGKAPWKVNLPSPYWFGAATHDETGNDRATTTLAIAAYLNGVARQLEREGAAAIQFNEPALFYEPKPALDLAEKAMTRALADLTVPTTVAFPNGNAAPHMAWALRLPAATIGVDFIETPIEDLPRHAVLKPIQAQVIDSQESRLETPDALADLVGRIEERLKAPRLVLTHTWDLDFVSAEVAAKKLELLGALLPTRKVVA